MPSREALQTLLNPTSVALVGASEKSTFTALIVANLEAAGWGDRVFLVNPRSPSVRERDTYPTCQAIGQSIDLAVIMVPAEAVPEAMRDAAAAGARAVSLLTSGYAEMGAQGRQRQDALVALAEELGIVILGPNSLGFVNLHAGVRAMAQGDPPIEAGGVALISQSGASCGAMKDFAALSGIRLSHVITVGNEAMVTVGHLMGALVEDPNVQAFAIFMEGIKDPESFASAAIAAYAAGKAVVILKAGRSDLAATAAASHTGTLVGDDRVIDAVFARLGIMRVDTIEDMLVTAGLAAHTGQLERPGLGVVSMSGGACDIIADLAEPAGVTIATLSASTREALREALPPYGHPNNPLDITGAGVIDPTIWTRTIAAMGNDESVGLVAAVHSLPLGTADVPFYGQRYVSAVGEGLRELHVPSVYITQVTQPLGVQAQSVMAEAGLSYVVPGMRLGLDAIGRIARWSAQDVSWDRGDEVEAQDWPTEPLSEVQARAILAEAGVPLVPGWHVRSAEEASSAAVGLDGPLAIKVVSADIAHKTDVGGVRLNVPPQDVAVVYEQIVTACAPHGRVDGVLITPMRPDGVDLLVGVTRDPDWGLMLAVGLGGVLVEVIDDVQLLPLPVSLDSVRAALSRLRGARLLDGVRGGPPVDMDALASAITRVCDLAAVLGPDLEAIEINPLRAREDRVEALDVLVVRSGNKKE